MESFSFFLSLVLFDHVFAITNNLSNLLQSEQISYSAAASCIKANRTILMNLRSEEEWSKIWVKAVALAERCGVTVAALRSRRHCILPRHLDESSVVEVSVGRSTDAPIEEFRTDVYYTTLDAMIHKMNERFSELNLSLLKALDALIPNSDLFLNLSTLKPLLSQYDICEAAVEAEISTAKTFLEEEEPQFKKSLHSVYYHHSKVPESFTTIIQCYQIAVMLGVSSASAERSFSSLRRLKTCTRQ